MRESRPRRPPPLPWPSIERLTLLGITKCLGGRIRNTQCSVDGHNRRHIHGPAVTKSVNAASRTDIHESAPGFGPTRRSARNGITVVQRQPSSRAPRQQLLRGDQQDQQAAVVRSACLRRYTHTYGTGSSYMQTRMQSHGPRRRPHRRATGPQRRPLACASVLST